MCNSMGCGCGKGCTPAMVGKFLLVVGGLNWGLIGLGMILGKPESWNVVHMLLGSWAMFEAVVYVLVGVAAVMKLIGCKCQKCMSGHTCGTDGKMGGSM